MSDVYQDFGRTSRNVRLWHLAVGFWLADLRLLSGVKLPLDAGLAANVGYLEQLGRIGVRPGLLLRPAHLFAFLPGVTHRRINQPIYGAVRRHCQSKSA